MKPRFETHYYGGERRTYDADTGQDFGEFRRKLPFVSRPVPYHWVLGWRDQHKKCLQVSLANARLARRVASDQVSRYAKQALSHYRQMRKHEATMATYRR